MIRISVRLTLILLLVGPLAGIFSEASAQGFINAKYAGEFLGHGAGARSAGMGGAGVAVSNDVTAGYFNPAGLSITEYPQIAAFHESRFAGLFSYDFIAGSLPIDSIQTAALSVLRFGYGEIQDSRNALIDRNGNGIVDEDDRIDPALIEVGSAADWAFIGSYARRINERFAVGGNLKVLHKSLLDTSAWGVGFDLSARYALTDDITFAGTLSDATKSMLAWETGHQEFIVPHLRLGSAWRLQATDDHAVTPTVDALFRFEGREETTRLDLGVASLDVLGGLEYSYRDRAFLRGGLTELGQWSLGAGVRLPKLNIDYAFTAETDEMQGLGATHRVSLMLTLEEPRFARYPGD